MFKSSIESDQTNLFGRSPEKTGVSGESSSIFHSASLDDFDIDLSESEKSKNISEVSNLTKDFAEVDNFLKMLIDVSKSENSISITTIHKAEDLWNSLLEEFDYSIDVKPLVSANEDGEILFSFNLVTKYLSIRICDDLKFEIFKKNFSTNSKIFEVYYFTEEVVKSKIVRGFFIHQ
jgi:hypothetical protein